MTQTSNRPKNAGRKKGVPNKNTQLIFDLCQKNKFCPIETLILVGKGDWKSLGYESPEVEKMGLGGVKIFEDRIQLDHRIDACKKLIDYMYPKRKAIELTGDDEHKPIVLSYNVTDIKKAASPGGAK